MPPSDYGSYKDQRRREDRRAAESIKRGGEEDMFFGASPEEKKALRKTPEKKGVDLDSLDLNAIDRERYGAGEKVGENLKLIDMAMGNEPPPPPQQTSRPATPPTKRSAKRRQPKRRKGISGFLRAKLSRRPTPPRDDFRPAPAGEDEGVVVARPRGRLLEVLAWILALVALGLALGLGYGAGRVPAIASVPAEADPEAAWAAIVGSLWTREVLLGAGLTLVWFAAALRAGRKPRGALPAEALRALLVGGLPAAGLTGFMAWATLPLRGAPPALTNALTEALAPAAAELGAPTWAVGAILPAALCLLGAFVWRLRAPRVGETPSEG